VKSPGRAGHAKGQNPSRKRPSLRTVELIAPQTTNDVTQERLAVRIASLILITLFAAAPSAAQQLFRVETTVPGVGAEGNNLLGLVEDLLDQTGDFSALQAVPSYTARLDYLGVQDAVVLEVSNLGEDLTLRIPSTGAIVAFDTNSPEALEDEVETFIKRDAADTWAAFLESMAGQSPLALLDGNPRATTALMANSAFRRFGLNDTHSRIGYREQEVSRFGTFGITLEVAGGPVETDDFDDLTTVDGSLEIGGEFNDTVGLAFSVIGQYRDYQATEMYDVGLELGLPIRLARPTEGRHLYWAVTPVLQAAAGVSPDAAAGGLFMGGGLVNTLALQIGPIELGMGNQLIYYGGLPVKNIQGYDFETHLDQLILKNGLKAGFRPFELLYAEAGLTLTNFLLDDAALDSYWTPFVSCGLRLGRFVELRASYEADLAKHGYRGQRGRLELGASF
jgi:hypothetical protein